SSAARQPAPSLPSGRREGARGPGKRPAHDVSTARQALDAEILNDPSGRSRIRTCDFVRVNGDGYAAPSIIAEPCAAAGPAPALLTDEITICKINQRVVQTRHAALAAQEPEAGPPARRCRR